MDSHLQDKLPVNRRSLFVGAGFAVAAPALVAASSMLDIPGDPLSRRGMFAASKWATEHFDERPGCRMTFSNGFSYEWQRYQNYARPINLPGGGYAYAVALEVVTSDENGKRFITSIPIDGVKLAAANTLKAWGQREWERKEAVTQAKRLLKKQKKLIDDLPKIAQFAGI